MHMSDDATPGQTHLEIWAGSEIAVVQAHRTYQRRTRGSVRRLDLWFFCRRLFSLRNIARQALRLAFLGDAVLKPVDNILEFFVA